MIYENSSDDFNIEHCLIKVKVTFLFHLPHCKLLCPTSGTGLEFVIKYVC